MLGLAGKYPRLQAMGTPSLVQALIPGHDVGTAPKQRRLQSLGTAFADLFEIIASHGHPRSGLESRKEKAFGRLSLFRLRRLFLELSLLTRLNNI